MLCSWSTWITHAERCTEVLMLTVWWPALLLAAVTSYRFVLPTKRFNILTPGAGLLRWSDVQYRELCSLLFVLTGESCEWDGWGRLEWSVGSVIRSRNSGAAPSSPLCTPVCPLRTRQLEQSLQQRRKNLRVSPWMAQTWRSGICACE